MTFALGLGGVFSCATKSEVSEQVSKQTNIATEISRNEAVKAARQYISSEYDTELYDATVIDRKTYWGIEFVFKKEYEHLTGGGAVVEIDKESGKVINHYFAK